MKPFVDDHVIAKLRIKAQQDDFRHAKCMADLAVTFEAVPVRLLDMTCLRAGWG